MRIYTCTCMWSFTRVRSTLWSPPVSLNQERHTQRRKVAHFIFILYISVLEAWGAPAGLMRVAQANLARRLSGRFLGGVPQTQTSKDPAFDVDTHLAVVLNLWTNSNNCLQPPSSTRLSWNSATFYFSCAAIFLFPKKFEIFILLATFLPPLEKGTGGYNHGKIPAQPKCVCINTPSFMSATSIGQNKLCFPSGYVFQTQRIGRGCRIDLAEIVNGSEHHVTNKQVN
jgi:hypothetical protein